MKHSVEFTVDTNSRNLPIAIVQNRPVSITCNICVNDLPLDPCLTAASTDIESAQSRIYDVFANQLHRVMEKSKKAICMERPPIGFGYLLDIAGSNLYRLPVEPISSIGIEFIVNGSVDGFLYIGPDCEVYHCTKGKVMDRDEITTVVDIIATKFGIISTKTTTGIAWSIPQAEYAVESMAHKLCSVLTYSEETSDVTVAAINHMHLCYFAMVLLKLSAPIFRHAIKKYECRWKVYREGESLQEFVGGDLKGTILTRESYGSMSTAKRVDEGIVAIFTPIPNKDEPDEMYTHYYLDVVGPHINFYSEYIYGEVRSSESTNVLGSFFVNATPSGKQIVYKNYKSDNVVILASSLDGNTYRTTVDVVAPFVEKMIHTMADEHCLDFAELDKSLHDWGLGLVDGAVCQMLHSILSASDDAKDTESDS